jgi:F-type H+-transporting ATPase subunit delta
MELLDRIFGKGDKAGAYATALVAVAEAEGDLGKVEDELFAFAKAAEQNPTLREALNDQGLPVENRQALVRDILGGKGHLVTVNLLSFLIESGRARDLSKIADAFVQLAAASREHAVAEVRSAVPLTDKQRERLQKALSTATGRTVETKVVIDPTVIGGVIARVDDLVFDGSVSSRLEDAKHALGS